MKLKFLDAKMITKSEWSLIQPDEQSNARQQPTSVEVAASAMDKMSLWRKVFKSNAPKETEVVANGPTTNFTPLPTDIDNFGQAPRSTYRKVKHYYKGTESQGNRFIGNTML